MKSNAHQSIAVNVPAWLDKACDDHRFVNLADTRTYRLLLSIFQAVISSAVTTSGIEDSLEDEMHDFTAWFLSLVNSMPAYVGLMWVYQELGQKALSADAKFSTDRRLADLLLTFVVLVNAVENDDLPERYHGMIGEGWDTCGPDEFKDSLHQGLIATLTTHAYSELVSIGKAGGVPESRTKKSLRSLAKMKRSEQRREAVQGDSHLCWIKTNAAVCKTNHGATEIYGAL